MHSPSFTFEIVDEAPSESEHFTDETPVSQPVSNVIELAPHSGSGGEAHVSAPAPAEDRRLDAARGDLLGEPPAPGGGLALPQLGRGGRLPRVHDARPSAPTRPRSQTSVVAVERVADTLFGRVDPTAPGSYGVTLKREVQRFYAPEVLKPDRMAPSIDYRLACACTAGTRMYLQGAALGVGASTLVSDYARAFNMRAREAHDPRRVCYVPILPGCGSVPRFLDALSLALHAPLTTTELTKRSSEYLSQRLVAAARMQGISALVLDHVGNAEKPVLRLIGGLLRALDPSYSVSFDPAGDVAMQRIGVVLVDHRPPEVLFRTVPDALLALEGEMAVLPPYTTVEQIAHALRQAGIGLDDCDPSLAADEATAEAVLELTHGLPALMKPLFELVDQIAVAHRRRPDAALVRAAIPYYRKMVDLRAVGGGATTRYRTAVPLVANSAHGEADDEEGEAAGRQAPPRASAPRRPTSRADEIRRMNRDRAAAALEHRDMTRSKSVVLPSA